MTRPLAGRDDCADQSIHPLHHTLTADYSPRRQPCTRPQFIRVRAILSWNAEPPSGTPDHQPVWGSVLDCTIQVAPAWRVALADLIDEPKLISKLKLPDDLAGLRRTTDPGTKAASEYSLQKLAKQYRQANVEAHRWAMAPALAATAGSAVTAAQVEAVVGEFKLADLDLADILGQVGDTQGNVSYEELECLGLDDNREGLVATFRIKRSSGYSGPLCSDGSTEYVAFWVDWGDTCVWTYAGTAEVKAHDLPDVPDGGLCYSAVLPVDLEQLRRDCDEPRVARIRAVLSWNAPPSTTDPDDLPVWGNRVDTHVRVLPGVTGDPDTPTTRGSPSSAVQRHAECVHERYQSNDRQDHAKCPVRRPRRPRRRWASVRTLDRGSWAKACRVTSTESRRRRHPNRSGRP